MKIKKKIKIPRFVDGTDPMYGSDISYTDAASQAESVVQENNKVLNEASFFENVKPWYEYITDVVADAASMVPRPEVQVVADTYQGDVDGLVRDAQQAVVPVVRKKMTQRGNYLQTLPNPPRRVLPAQPGESPYHRQRRQVLYNRANPRMSLTEMGYLFKGLGKALIPYQLYLMYKDAQQLWGTIKNYPKRDKGGIYKYNKK